MSTYRKPLVPFHNCRINYNFDYHFLFAFRTWHLISRKFASFLKFSVIVIVAKEFWRNKKDMKRMMDDLELRNKKMKVMVDSVPTCTIPRTILQDYKDQKPLDYEFLCCDGSIHISELALRHSDFYIDMCKGMVCKNLIVMKL